MPLKKTSVTPAFLECLLKLMREIMENPFQQILNAVNGVGNKVDLLHQHTDANFATNATAVAAIAASVNTMMAVVTTLQTDDANEVAALRAIKDELDVVNANVLILLQPLQPPTNTVTKIDVVHETPQPNA